MRNFMDLTEAFDFELKKYIAQGTANIAGDGLWSETHRWSVQGLRIKLLPEDIFWFDEVDEIGNPILVGNINAYFDPRDWNVKELGLIYTDSEFEKDVRQILKTAGFRYYRDLAYSEQGMQGSDYVNFDVGRKLATELDTKGFIEVTKYEDLEKI